MLTDEIVRSTSREFSYRVVIFSSGSCRNRSGAVAATATGEYDNPITEFSRRAANYLVGQHFNEVVNYTLRSEAEQQNWSDSVSRMALGLKNPISEDQTQLRHSLLPEASYVSTGSGPR